MWFLDVRDFCTFAPRGDHGVDDAWWISHGCDPLVEDHVVHKAKEANHEDKHWHALTCKIYLGTTEFLRCAMKSREQGKEMLMNHQLTSKNTSRETACFHLRK